MHWSAAYTPLVQYHHTCSANINLMATNSSFFSCDLVDLAQKHIWFLQQAHALRTPSTVTTPAATAARAAESLYRYQYVWLPLVAKEGDSPETQQLIPPPDIAWFWHCHRLAPAQYRIYCERRFGRVLEANPPFAMALPYNDSKGEPDSLAEKTISLWAKHYPTESYFLSDDDDYPKRGKNSGILLGFDLLGSVERQTAFLWQVSGERFSDQDFLEDGVTNYAKFLLLKPKASALGIILVPTYQIDLMWHTHILSSIENYNKDCFQLMDSTISHDDSLTDRSADGILQTSFDATRELWKNEYGVDYVVPGGMYRGEPPTSYYSSEWLHNPCVSSVPCGFPSQPVGVALMGASSVPQRCRRKWADVKGLTSDGSPAFIKSEDQMKRDIRREIRKDDYILGRYEAVTGFYHIETREAHSIMVTRLDYMIQRAQSNIAFEASCCASHFRLKELENKVILIKQVRDVWKERLAADRPMGNTPTRNVQSARLQEDDGRWAYPPALYMYSGGACGGAVAMCGDGGGAAGCGGACGGGGCGGGGCGGGGCGGGGCGG